MSHATRGHLREPGMIEVEQALLDAIARDPEDPAPYLVYADWLQAQGAPRGALAALQGTLDARDGDQRLHDALSEHMRDHAEAYLGPLAPVLDHPDLELEWRCGFIGSAVLRVGALREDRWEPPPPPMSIPPREVLAALLELESARFLTRLVIEPRGADVPWVAGILARRPLPSLRRLWLGAPEPGYGQDEALGDLSDVWRCVPQLRELGLVGMPAALGAIDLPHLRHATLRFPPSGDSPMRAMAGARWPELERLHLMDADGYHGFLDLLSRDDLATLGELALVGCPYADAMCGPLVGSPLAPQLNRLSFARGGLTDRGAAALVEHRDAFPNLVRIDVSQTFVSDTGVQLLRRLAPEVIARDRRRGPG